VGRSGTTLTAQQLLFVTLVFRMLLMSLLAVMLVRYHRFRDLLIHEHRGWPMKTFFAVGLGVPLAAGVGARLLLGYDGLDVTLEGAYLAGLVTGPWGGALVGAMLGLPPLPAREWLALPFAVGCGFAGGGIRKACPQAAIWQFSPFVLQSVHRYVWRIFRNFSVDWQVVLLAAPIGLSLLQQAIMRRRPGLLYGPEPQTPLESAVVVLAAVVTVAVPMKIWNDARNEHRVQEQERLLMKARIAALSQQINPHFLFNTLASISSLIRTNPESARTLILRLSTMLRRRLRQDDDVITLREELASVDEYLAIEAIRFGPQLVLERAIAEDVLDRYVPSMILQPIVENAIKHGIAPSIGGGRVAIRARHEDGRTIVEVEDSGPGVEAGRAGPAVGAAAGLSPGIGLRNVRERLQVMYGDRAGLDLASAPGRGTVARLEIPDVDTRNGGLP